MTIFVDIDGVLSDFVATLEHMGIILPAIRDYSFNQEDISTELKAEVFLAMNHEDYAIKSFPCFKAINLFRGLSQQEEVRVLTARRLHKEATIDWIRTYFGDYQVKFTTAPKAEFLWAGDVLYDDCPHHLTIPGQTIPTINNKKQAYLDEILKHPDNAYNFTYLG